LNSGEEGGVRRRGEPFTLRVTVSTRKMKKKDLDKTGEKLEKGKSGRFEGWTSALRTGGWVSARRTVWGFAKLGFAESQIAVWDTRVGDRSEKEKKNRKGSS